MLTKRIIPCLDVKGGRVVKGVRFLDHRDAGDPVEMAAFYDKEGADELVFYDITASSEGRAIMIDVVEKVAEQVFIPLTVGGGLRTVDDMQQMLQAGADKVSINTAAVEDPDLIRQGAEHFGCQCIVLGLDAMRVPDSSPPRWEVRVRTGHDGGQPTGLDATEWAKRAVELGAGEIGVNSMDRDGTRRGFDIPLTRTIADSVPIPVIASGGVGTLDHLVEGVTEGHASAVLAASIFHFGTYTIAEAKAHMKAAGANVRNDPI